MNLLQRALCHQLIQDVSEFFAYSYGNNRLHHVINRLSRCSMTLIPLYNGGASGKSNHWGLTVLDKATACIRVCDSLHELFLFRNLMPLIRRLAESIGTRYEIPEQIWPRNWTLSQEIYSVQQRNSSDCGIFTTLNAIFVSRGTERPNIIPEKPDILEYRSMLALCILEYSTEFLV